MTHRPITTLFLLQSVDGKITTGASDALDFERAIVLRDEIQKLKKQLKKD